MTLNRSRGREDLEKRLRERSTRFQEELNKLETPEESFGIRITALPVGENVRFDRVYPMRDELLPPWQRVFEKNGDKRKLDYPTKFFRMRSKPLEPWQPIRHGARLSFAFPKDEPRDLGRQGSSPNETYMFSYHELHCDGLLELGYASCNQGCRANENSAEVMWFNPDWPLVLLANTIVWATQIRSHSPAPMAEYSLEIEILHRGEKAVRVGKIDALNPYGCHPWDILGKIISDMKFSEYSLDHEETPAALLQTFCRHFLNSLGIGKEIEFEVGAI